jgi:hypothetical protein
MGIIKPEERSRQSESSIELVAHTKSLTQPKKPKSRNNQIPLNINTMLMASTPSSKDTNW